MVFIHLGSRSVNPAQRLRLLQRRLEAARAATTEREFYDDLLTTFAELRDLHTTFVLPELFAALKKRWPDARVNNLDGLRLDWKDRWVHVRPSNTEPLLRLNVEAPDKLAMCQLRDEVLARTVAPGAR